MNQCQPDITGKYFSSTAINCMSFLLTGFCCTYLIIFTHINPAVVPDPPTLSHCRNPTPDASLGFTWEAIEHENLKYLDLNPSPTMKPDHRRKVEAFYNSCLSCYKKTVIYGRLVDEIYSKYIFLLQIREFYRTVLPEQNKFMEKLITLNKCTRMH